jgi:hypothetical protein
MTNDKAHPAGLSISRELLTYLGTLPKNILNGSQGPEEIAINLGNCLIWISSQLEKGPQIEQGMHESPQSVWALGKQLREAGLEIIRRNQSAQSRMGAEYLESRLHALEEKLEAFMAGRYQGAQSSGKAFAKGVISAIKGGSQ